MSIYAIYYPEKITQDICLDNIQTNNISFIVDFSAHIFEKNNNTWYKKMFIKIFTSKIL